MDKYLKNEDESNEQICWNSSYLQSVLVVF